MNLDTRARDAGDGIRTATRVDAEDGLRRLHRTRQRRTAGKVVAAVAAVTMGAAVVQSQLDRDREVPPVSPPDNWVLVTGSGVGGADNPVQPEGDEWAEPLAEQGVQGFPDFRSADPATQRFLVINMDATAWHVMTPGRSEPLTTYDCGSGCFTAALGPGTDELTTISSAFTHLVVVGPDGAVRRNLSTVWTASGPERGLLDDLTWSPDGETWAETRLEHDADEGSLTVVLRDPDSREESTLYVYSEAAPAWYDAEEHRFADGPGNFNDWGAPRLADLRWSPDSTRLAFATMTTPEGESGRRQVQWQLFVGDTATGEVEQIADLGRCEEPFYPEGGSSPACDERSPSLTWTPDGESLTVLQDGSLTTYDLTGKVLDSEPTGLEGPVVWLESE